MDSDLRQLAEEPGIESLPVLDLAGKELSNAAALAKCLEPLSQLTSLNLVLNRLSDAAALAKCLKPLTQLTTLGLGHNKLSDAAALAEGLKPLTQLTSLDLGSNKLSDPAALAECLKPLTKLTWLNLTGNELSDAAALAEGLNPLTRLMYLCLRGNRFSDAAALADCLKPLTKLTWLDLSGNELSDAAALAQGLRPLAQLTSLDLSHNRLSDAAALAEGLRSLVRLSRLDLRFNKLSDAAALAEGLRVLTQLTTLHLGNNGLSDAAALGECLRPLTRLTTLGLWGNGLSAPAALAEGLKPLSQLTTLHLGNNGLSDAAALAECLKPLTQLTSLQLNMNEFSDAAALAECLKPLTQLTSLDLGSNKLSDPAALAECLKPLTKLTWLDLSGNELGLPDEVLWTHDPRRILAAIAEMEAGQARPVLEVKLVVLGDGRMGKTQVVNRLRGKPYEPNSTSTSDFQVHPLLFEEVGPEGQDITARVYDFGGEAQLWSAHRFFLATRHTLFVVVIDGTRQDQRRLEYWMEYIRHYTRTPEEANGCDPKETRPEQVEKQVKVPVLVVYTNCDRKKPVPDEGREPFETIEEANAKALIEHYRDVAEVRVVREYSSATDDGLPDVQKHLRELIGAMDYLFRTHYSLALHKVKAYLEGTSRKVGWRTLKPFAQSMTVGELYNLFGEASEGKGKKPEGADCRLWLQVLRNLGVVHWVGDAPGAAKVDPGGTVANTVYHPGRIRKLVYGIIRHTDAHRYGGVGDRATLRKMLCDACGQECQEKKTKAETCLSELLELMEVCHLAFRGSGRMANRWIVLDWLPTGRGFILPDTPACVLELTPFVPESLLLRYAGNHFKRIATEGEFPSLSRDHVVVCEAVHGMAQAGIKADWQTRQITIWGLGGTPEERSSVVNLARGVLWDLAQEEGLAPRLLSVVQVRRLGIAQEKLTTELTNEAKDQMLTGLVMFKAGQCNVIYRDLTEHDHGLDGLLEFRREDGKLSGRMAFLQLKSGDSYIRESKETGEEVFYVKNVNHLEYWKDPQADVHLVVGDSDWRVRWMNITRYLNDPKNQKDRRIVFAGAEFDAQSIERVRQECLKQKVR